MRIPILEGTAKRSRTSRPLRVAKRPRAPRPLPNKINAYKGRIKTSNCKGRAKASVGGDGIFILSIPGDSENTTPGSDPEGDADSRGYAASSASAKEGGASIDRLCSG